MVMIQNNKVRLDKWLWSVRIYKSRTIAIDACKMGRIKVNDITQKPSFLVSLNDNVTVKKNGFNLQFIVLQIIEKRVSASIAVTCYSDITPTEELNKYKDWFIGKSGAEIRDKGEGRPTKKDRREMDEFKDNYLEDFESFDEI